MELDATFLGATAAGATAEVDFEGPAEVVAEGAGATAAATTTGGALPNASLAKALALAASNMAWMAGSCGGAAAFGLVDAGFLAFFATGARAGAEEATLVEVVAGARVDFLVEVGLLDMVMGRRGERTGAKKRVRGPATVIKARSSAGITMR